MNFKAILSLSIIALILFSIVGNINATTISVDADGRMVHKFKITDMTTEERIWTQDVAAGKSHKHTFNGNDHKLHQLLVEVDYVAGSKNNPNHHSILLNMYNGKDITLYGRLDYNSRKVHYDSSVDYSFGSLSGNMSGSLVI